MMTDAQKSQLLDLVAALSHDLRSTLSSASLAAGLMSTHADEEVRGFAARLTRTVQTQTALLDLASGLVRSAEGEAQDSTLKDFAALLREHEVEVRGGDLPERVIPAGRLIAAALGRVLKGRAVDVEIGHQVSLIVDMAHEAPGSRSTTHVVLAACGVRIDENENGSRFVLEA